MIALFPNITSALNKWFIGTITASLLAVVLGSPVWAQEKIAAFPPLPHHYVTIKVVTPTGLSERSRDLLREIDKMQPFDPRKDITFRGFRKRT